MSLDVYLKSKPSEVNCVCSTCENVHTRMQSEYYYDSNITHNLTRMADKAGVYYALWRPEEKGWSKASDLIPVLEKGLKELKAKPDYFKQFNPDNGWGSYENLMEFVENYLSACKEYPDSIISVSR